MTKFACRYGVDSRRPEAGVIIACATDDQTLDLSHHPGCLYLELPGSHEQWGRFGPVPELMGDAPAACFPCHDELDREDVPDNHQLRRVAGLPREDNRRPATDMRPWAAPDLTSDLARSAKRLEMTAALDAAAIGGFESKALGRDEPYHYPSDADSETKLQMAALAALMGSRKDGWTAVLRCAEVKKKVVGDFVGVAHTAAQVHAVLADYQAFTDALHAERDAVEAQIVSARTVFEILAVTRG